MLSDSFPPYVVVEVNCVRFKPATSFTHLLYLPLHVWLACILSPYQIQHNSIALHWEPVLLLSFISLSLLQALGPPGSPAQCFDYQTVIM